jgi:protein-disulfide isomerase
MEDNQEINKSEVAMEKKDEKVSLEFSKTTLWQVIAGVLGVLFIVSIFTSGFGFNSPTGAVIKDDGNNNVGNDNNIPTGPIDVSADDDPAKGDKNAPVTIIEFSDFQCPFCARFHTQTLPQIKSKYIDTGKVKLVYRDFPLTSIHPNAEPAAEASECADEQGKFWEMHDLLFEKQDEWSDIGISKFKDYAKELNLDADKFNKCLDSSKYKDEISKDMQDGVAAGVQGTPAFFVNGILLSGAQPFTAFDQVIQQELNK